MRDEIAPEIVEYYQKAPEEARLDERPYRLEHRRTKAILERVLPPPPATILDVGGAAGVYAFWLADRGYAVHLIDPVARLVDLARKQNAKREHRIVSCGVGDARSLPFDDATAEVALLLGPLYHLPEAADRARTLREARRVLKPGGAAIVAAISRYASALAELGEERIDPRFSEIVERDLETGVHLNDTGKLEYFTTAYFHVPDELRREVEEAGLVCEAVIAVEGPGWLLPDLQARLDDGARRDQLFRLLERLETEPSLLGVSAHLLAIGRKA